MIQSSLKLGKWRGHSEVAIATSVSMKCSPSSSCEFCRRDFSGRGSNSLLLLKHRLGVKMPQPGIELRRGGTLAEKKQTGFESELV